MEDFERELFEKIPDADVIKKEAEYNYFKKNKEAINYIVNQINNAKDNGLDCVDLGSLISDYEIELLKKKGYVVEFREKNPDNCRYYTIRLIKNTAPPGRIVSGGRI